MKLKIQVKFLIISLFFFSMAIGCIINEDSGNSDNNSQYTLTVSLGSGVSGYPSTGSYNYADGSTANYAYSLETGYSNLRVLLDGTNVAASGSIQMNNNHTLSVTADTQSATYDVRGHWIGSGWDSNGDPDPLEVTFSGTSTLTGDTRGYMNNPANEGTGHYNVSVTDIQFDLWYGSVRNFQFTGTFSDNSHMSGTWIWTNQSGDKFYGTWKLTR